MNQDMNQDGQVHQAHSHAQVASLNNQRLTSIDALRGLTVAAMLLVNNAGDWNYVYLWLSHSSWHGASPADFIFPFFLVIVGVSLYLALTPKFEQGLSARQLAPTIIWRACKIFALGVVLHLVAVALIPDRQFRLMGVLQRIGLCFLVAGLLFIYLRSLKQLWYLIFAILLSYWYLLASAGSYQAHLNLVDQIDTRVLGSLAYHFDLQSGLAQEPEGILSTVSAIVSVLLGIQAGAILRRGQASNLLLLGLVMCACAYLWSFVLPINKHLWTSSFVLWTTGFAYLIIWLMHQLIDRLKLPAIGLSFGVNAIAAYAGSWVATCVLAGTGWMDKIYGGLFVPIFTPINNPYLTSLAFAIVFTATFAVLMLILRKIGWRFSV
ncbi:membrane protein [Undibacterium macrobrachii]|uniref:Membrane protein n=2 Tax=Undibacterium macrobrachii TaxID=1119058 RepID=A0ABQ2XKZ1_9BURK|nr:membrane protein [Undibacterium macrobrachii]